MYDYVEARLVPRRDGSIDVTHSGLIAEKVPYLRNVINLTQQADE